MKKWYEKSLKEQGKNLFIILGILLVFITSVILIFTQTGLLSVSATAPKISDISITPENPTLSETVTICADVESTSKLSIVRINLRRENPVWNWGLVMSNSETGGYGCDEQKCNFCRELSRSFMKSTSTDRTRSYYISARNSLGETTKTDTYYYTYLDPIEQPTPPTPKISEWISDKWNAFWDWLTGLFG